MFKNKVEVKEDIVLVHVNSKGKSEIVIMDRTDAFLLTALGEIVNRLNIDSMGFVQHRKQVNGKYDVFQLHRVIANAFDGEKVGFHNGNKLDIRRRNLFTY